MGLLGALKKATGIGLSARERYSRAFEKAVLLGPASFAAAPELFEDARAKAVEEGDTALADRASANALLYRFITGSEGLLESLRDALERVPEIERIGLQTETMDAVPLRLEIEARIAESAIAGHADGDHGRLANLHATAADRFKAFLTAPLVTYRFRAEDRFVESAQQRFFLHQAHAARHLALGTCHASPEKAAEHMARALGAFRQCDDDEQVRASEAWLSQIRLRRTCWLCHREMQGAGLHFDAYAAQVAPYAIDVVAQLGQDTSSLDSNQGRVILCRPCGSMVEAQADLFARRRTEELAREVAAKIQSLQSTILALEARMAVMAMRR